MNRIKLFLTILPFLAISNFSYAAPIDQQKCYCTPSDSCWPTSSDLDTFVSKLSSADALIREVHPPAFPCHDPNYDNAACALVNSSWNNPFWISEQPGAMQDHSLESSALYAANGTISCSIDPAQEHNPCGQGAVPSFGINVKTEQDIVEALNLASEHNLRVVVKSTGHDFFGRSTAPDSLLIWTHNLKDISVEQTFSADGCSNTQENKVLRIGAGVQWEEAYNAASSANRVVVGGISANGTVGAGGGWVQGAGHSILSPSYGLGVDNVLQFRVVLTPDDEHKEARVVTANACSEPDLFWALRGGGGGSFGVVTQVVYKTYQESPGLTGKILFGTNSSDVFKPFLTEFLNGLPTLSENGWGGYWGMSSDPSFTAIPGIAANYIFSYSFLRAGVSDADVDSVNSTITPLLNKLQTITNSPIPLWNVDRVKSFHDWYISTLGAANPNLTPSSTSSENLSTLHLQKRSSEFDKRQDQTGSTTTTASSNYPNFSIGTLGSRLLPAELHSSDNSEKLVELLVGGTICLGHQVAGGQVSKQDPESMSVNPAWRSAVTHLLTFKSSVDQSGKSPSETLMEAVGGDGGGCYLNEAAYDDPAWPKSYWGDHYSLLVDIKHKYDPFNRFVVPRGIASDEWNEDLRCRK